MISRAHTRNLYRSIIRAALQMPTQNRRDWLRKKARAEFKKNKSETDDKKIDFMVKLAETQLENIQIQSQHLSSLFSVEPKERFTDIRHEDSKIK